MNTIKLNYRKNEVNENVCVSTNVYENKEKHLQYMKQQLHCDVCDKLMTRSHYNRHTKTRIHKLLMNQKPVITP